MKIFSKKKLIDINISKNLILQNFFVDAEKKFHDEGFRENFSNAVENILIVRLDAIGDFILTTGVIREVRKNFPKAQITLVVSLLVYPVAEFCPYVNEILHFNGKIDQKIIMEMDNFLLTKNIITPIEVVI